MLEEKVLRTIETYNMIRKGDIVVVALSGGADSMALFHFLLQQRDTLGISVEAAHFEHGWRGAESEEDARFVADVCARYDICLHMAHGKMMQREKPANLGMEAWARQLRYSFFEELAKNRDIRVATAHTASDNAETVLFNMIRGSFVKGLAGIPPVREPYIRPLLDGTRDEVEDYCGRMGLDYVTDSTNSDETLSRNLLRNQVMPLLEQVHPGTQAAFNHLANDMREMNNTIKCEADKLLILCDKTGDTVHDYIDKPYFASVHKQYSRHILLEAFPFVRRTAFAQILETVSAPVDRARLAGMEAVVQGNSRALQLPNGLEWRMVGEAVVLQMSDACNAVCYKYALQEGALRLPGGYQVTVCVRDNEKMGDILQETPKKDLTFVADYDKISKRSVFRPRRVGDFFRPQGRHLTKKVKKLMQEMKLPVCDRDKMPLLVDEDGQVLWLWHVGFAEGLAPEVETTKVLILQQEMHTMEDDYGWHTRNG